MFERLGPHAGFILWSYCASAVIIGGLVWWILARHRAAAQRLALQERASRKAGPQ